MRKSKARILLYDIETSPNLAYVWGKYEQTALAYERESEFLSISWKWLGDKKVHVLTRTDFKLNGDRKLVKKLRSLLDQADLVIGHNSNAFDNVKANARFIAHKLNPPAPYLKVDTLAVARSQFKFNSNSLNDICEHLGIGQKTPTGGFKLWLDCMKGSRAAFKKMGLYNQKDVVLLEKVYLRLRPWINTHPNLALINDRPNSCPRCGSKSFSSKGHYYTRTVKYRRYLCNDCGGSFRSQSKSSQAKPGVMPV